MDDRTISRGSAGKPQVLREFEFYGGCIRVKISVKNTSSLAILDAALELESDERVLHYDRCEPAYTEKQGKIILGNINPNTDRTIAFYLDPLICAKEGTDINCRVNFKHADGTPDTVNMEKLKIQVVCPIFRTEHDINIGRLKELIKELHSNDSKVYTIPKRVDIAESLKTCRNVIQQHDVRHIKTFKTTDDTTYECWYFGKTKVTKKDLVIKCAIRKDMESIEIFVSGNDPKDITGLLAEIGRNLTKEFDKIGKVQPVFNVVVKNSMLKGSNLLSFCNLDGTCGGDVVIEDSVVQRSNIASWNETAQKEREEAQKREKEEQERLRRQMEEEERALGEKKTREDAEKRESERQKARQEEERIAKEREKLSVSEKKEGISQIKFLAVALVLGVLLLGYWMLAPGATNAPETLKSTPLPTSTITTITVIQTPKVSPTVSSTPIITQVANRKTITNFIGMEFVQIPAGEFDMGLASNRYDGPIHRVKIAKDFYMGKYEVTQKQWSDIMGNNPSNFKGDNLPVEQVSWNDAQEFIKKLNEKEGTNKYRLPSEAEWEYAARAGTTTGYSFGDNVSMLGDFAWYIENSDRKTHEVGRKNPNPWGLYDMHGNVWEWVQDRLHEGYKDAPVDGSAWETGHDESRVRRGGSWESYAWNCQSAIRGSVLPTYRDSIVGFRLLRIL